MDGQTSAPQRRRPVWLPPRQITPWRLLVGMAVLIVAFAVAFLGLFLWIDYKREVATAQAYGDSALEALSGHVQRLVATNDLLLQQLLDQLKELPADQLGSDFRLWHELRSRASLPQIDSTLAVFDRSGEVVVTTRGFGDQMPELNVADQAYFAELRDNATTGLVIGPTVFSEVDGNPYMRFSRRWTDAEGRFLGIVRASVRADAFLDVAEKLAFGPRSTVSVVRTDGRVLIRRPLTREAVEANLAGYPLFTRYLLRTSRGGYIATSPLDRVRRFVRYQQVEGLPLIAIVGLSVDEVLASWRRHAYEMGGLMLLSTAMVLALAYWAAGYAAREEEALRELASSREHERLLLAELEHRAKNFLMIVHSVVRQTARTTADKQAMEEALLGRLRALGSAQALLTADNWHSADLRALVQNGVGPFVQATQLKLDGPPARVPAKAAVTLGMMIHELATNAVKYGALSVPQGRLTITWAPAEDGSGSVLLRWIERDGPPVVPPDREGFGTALLAHGGHQDVALDYRPEGLQATITVRLMTETEPSPRPTVGAPQMSMSAR